MEQIRTTDNNCGSKCFINGEHYPILPSSINEKLSKVANKSIAALVANNSNFLVFPQSLEHTKDKIGENHLFSIVDDKLHTNNMMGFIGINDTQLTISSRFHTDGKDYFLHYMLQKVFSINLVDLQLNNEPEKIWDFLLIYLFPYYFKKAINQGLYKEYVRNNYNDANVKGTIDINRHLKENLPFRGTVSYSTREHTLDNRMTQLIRHTQEFIRNKSKYASVLNCDKETRAFVSLIDSNTRSYNQSNRQKIIQENIKRINHPFYTEYEVLRKICLQILRREGLTFGKKDENKVYGLVFDGAWLWEEFLNTYLSKEGFVHPTNNNRGNPIYLFENNKFPRYPDFYKDELVIDAKYKSLNNKTGHDKIDRDDIHQIVTYMYALKSKKGGFIYPLAKDELTPDYHLGKLNGHGGDVYFYGVKIPSVYNDFNEFGTFLSRNVNETIELIKCPN